MCTINVIKVLKLHKDFTYILTQNVSTILGPTSLADSSYQTNKMVHTNICPEVSGFLNFVERLSSTLDI